MRLRFTKMEGCGNDYVYIDTFTQQVPGEEKPALVRHLSDRHFGIGGDGVIFIGPSALADFEMEMYNADGSRGEMCGNGIRCVGKYVYDRGMTDARTVFTVESMRKVKRLELTAVGGLAQTVRVNMGAPVLEPERIPVLTEDASAKMLVDEPVEVDGRRWLMTCVSMGNPHAVIFLSQEEIRRWPQPGGVCGAGPDGTGKDAAATEPSLWDLDLTQAGPLFEQHARFPNRVNTEFVQVMDRGHVRMRVWERGAGETLACGTGACAVCVAGVLSGRTERAVEILLPGGKLTAQWDETSEEVYLTGPAREVFSGEMEIG